MASETIATATATSDGAHALEKIFSVKSEGGMANVASIIGILGARVDALQSELRSSRSDKVQGSDRSEDSGRAIELVKTVPGEIQQLRADVESAAEARRSMREEIQRIESSRDSAFKKEKSVIEAVLTQKLERRVDDKISALGKRVDEACESMEKLRERANAIATAVDKQARFLTDMNARIAQTIDASVKRAVQQSTAGSDAGTLDALEPSPVLDQSSPPARPTTSSDDQIEMVPANSATADKKPAKPRAKRASKSAASKSKDAPAPPADPEAATPAPDGDEA